MTRKSVSAWSQRLLAAPFLILGAWCLVAPHSVERLAIRAEHQSLNHASALLIGCFGAQAVLNGLFILFAKFTPATFLGYGLALLPFFWFNYYFVYVVPILNGWMAIDFAANVFMLALCVAGWRSASGSRT